MNDTTLTRMLRAHDPAASPEARVEAGAHRARLDARLAELPARDGVGGRSERPVSRRQTVLRRVAWLAAAAAAVSGAYLLLPGPGQGSAYASWTATPQALADQDRATAAQECRDAHRGPFWSRVGGGPEEFDPQAATVGLAERRGDLVAVLLQDQGPMKDFTGFCVVALEKGASDGRVTGHGVAGATGGPPSLAPADGFVEGSMSQSGTGDELMSMVAGPVGEDVVGLTMHADGLSVEATIEDGTYAAWFPGRIFPDRDWGPSGQGGPEPMITYDVTLRDGTVVKDAEPSMPLAP